MRKVKEISLEFIPWQLDLLKTFRYVSEDVIDDYLRIIMPCYDFMVKSHFSIFDTCLIDFEKGMNQGSVPIVLNY